MIQIVFIFSFLVLSTDSQTTQIGNCSIHPRFDVKGKYTRFFKGFTIEDCVKKCESFGPYCKAARFIKPMNCFLYSTYTEIKPTSNPVIAIKCDGSNLMSECVVDEITKTDCKCGGYTCSENYMCVEASWETEGKLCIIESENSLSSEKQTEEAVGKEYTLYRDGKACGNDKVIVLAPTSDKEKCARIANANPGCGHFFETRKDSSHCQCLKKPQRGFWENQCKFKDDANTLIYKFHVDFNLLPGKGYCRDSEGDDWWWETEKLCVDSRKQCENKCVELRCACISYSESGQNNCQMQNKNQCVIYLGDNASAVKTSGHNGYLSYVPQFTAGTSVSVESEIGVKENPQSYEIVAYALYASAAIFLFALGNHYGKKLSENDARYTGLIEM